MEREDFSKSNIDWLFFLPHWFALVEHSNAICVFF